MRHLVPFVQFKKGEKHLWRSVLLVKLQASAVDQEEVDILKSSQDYIYAESKSLLNFWCWKPVDAMKVKNLHNSDIFC